ncbi:hypothetical protein FIBSPDRAFT_863455 [Athelia psychrophila]|uniref:Uncharacterized protein n=1 Tax=Athelia psychrophila TaxID=1759441 RepID=A0A166HAX4_9AGAM|nr:hypothetical protein FIBSPDRAFT_863455 [Fibularhizoctonia sp. CBS 109695]
MYEYPDAASTRMLVHSERPVVQTYDRGGQVQGTRRQMPELKPGLSVVCTLNLAAYSHINALEISLRFWYGWVAIGHDVIPKAVFRPSGLEQASLNT